eukprot:2365250-Rhodomonas_salina.4
MAVPRSGTHVGSGGGRLSGRSRVSPRLARSSSGSSGSRLLVALCALSLRMQTTLFPSSSSLAPIPSLPFPSSDSLPRSLASDALPRQPASPLTRTHSLTHARTHSLTHSLSRSLLPSLTRRATLPPSCGSLDHFGGF